MNAQLFLNQTVINKNNERGIVVDCNDDHIIIKYKDISKTYSFDAVFKNHFLSFIDCSLNSLIDEYLSKKDEELTTHKKLIADNNAYAIKRNKEIIEKYKKLHEKELILKELFGYDFVYPPFSQFKKEYKKYIIRPDRKLYTGALEEYFNRKLYQ